MTPDEVVARGRELARRSRYRMGAFHPERFGFANPIPLSLHTRLMLIGTDDHDRSSARSASPCSSGPIP